MSTYGLDGKNILKLDKGVSSNVLTIIPSSSTGDDIKIDNADLGTPLKSRLLYCTNPDKYVKTATVTGNATFSDAGVLNVPFPPFRNWSFHNYAGGAGGFAVNAIAFDQNGMTTGAPGVAFVHESSQCADFGDDQFGTVVVHNTDGAYTAGRDYLVQIKTVAFTQYNTPVLITQEQGIRPTSGSRLSQWSNMPSGVFPSNRTSVFNIWFTPGSGIAQNNEIWFNWFIPTISALPEIAEVTRIETGFP